MVSVGLRGLTSRYHKVNNLTEEENFMGAEDNTNSKVGRTKRKMARKESGKRGNFNPNHSAENFSGGVHDEAANAKNKFPIHQHSSASDATFIRKHVDPETAKYFSEIANVIEGTELDLEERVVICGNALEEARGKEVELATDYILSHTMQTLLEGSSVEHLCGFLRSSAKNFYLISTDRSGSHVAETALKSLAAHLQDSDANSLIEETLTKICQEIVGNPVDIMCNRYGSHVLRSLLCLCKGVPLDSPEFHGTKSRNMLAERLSIRSSHGEGNDAQYSSHGFPELIKYLVTKMIDAASSDIVNLLSDQYACLVLQTALKLLAGHDQELLHIIPILLGCSTGDAVKGNLIEATAVENVLYLMEETGYSHLMEVILEVAPETLYDELVRKVFRNSLFKMACHQCGNFVVQSLISHARHQDHMDSIWEELGSKFRELLEMGRPGVVASLLATSQRLHSHSHQCGQALAAAICLASESPKCIVPRILFLDKYFCCEDKSNWSWPDGGKMHVIGSLILQSVFRLPNEHIQDYVTSITSLEDDQVLEASKDPSGSRVIEAFLSSNVSAKQKRKFIIKLRGHFGELGTHPSGSFIVEKCFSGSNLSLRETIVAELASVQTELSKTRQGPYLLRKLDVDGFARRPDQWKTKQTSKESTYKDYYAAFGSTGTKPSKNNSFLADTHPKSQPEKIKEMRKSIDASIASTVTRPSSQFLSHQGSKSKLNKSGLKRLPEASNKHTSGDVSEGKRKKQKR